jgi:hypothetical protein
MIEILSPLGKYKYDTWRILPVKCYIDNSVRLRSCIRNVSRHPQGCKMIIVVITPPIKKLIVAATAEMKPVCLRVPRQGGTCR